MQRTNSLIGKTNDITQILTEGYLDDLRIYSGILFDEQIYGIFKKNCLKCTENCEVCQGMIFFCSRFIVIFNSRGNLQNM